MNIRDCSNVDASSAMSVSRRFAEFVCELTYEDLPEDVKTAAKRTIADTVGVILAAKNEPVSFCVQQFAKGEKGQSTVLGTEIKTNAATAALANGTMAHAHDYDDSNYSMLGHASSPVLPAIMALADEIPVSGVEFMLGYILGVEIECKLGLMATFEHNARGWHTTSTLGTFGATAACARVMGLDVESTAHALSIAASMACGVRQNFGSMTKPLHAGIAAKNGVTAAKLARAGVTANPAAIEGEEGFLDLFDASGKADLESVLNKLGDPFEVQLIVPKRYSCCALVHPALDILLDAENDTRHDHQEVKEIRCETSFHALNLMRYHAPINDLEARFSIEYCLAAAYIDRELGPAQFAPGQLDRTDIQDLMSRVSVVLHPDQDTKEKFEKLYVKGMAVTQLSITYNSGEVFKGEAAVAKGDPSIPLCIDEIRKKFDNCVSPHIRSNVGHQIWESIFSLPEIDRVVPALIFGKT